MSDRTPSSVRIGSRDGDGATPAGNAAGEPVPVGSTQAIPNSGAMRAQGAGVASTIPPTTPSSGPAGGPPGAPPVPPSTGAAPMVPGAAPADARTGEPASSGRGSRGRGSRSGRGPRRARLQLRHIDTWSALKISLVLSIALFFIWMVAVGVLYGVLSGLGVFDTLNELFGQLSSSGGGNVITPGVVFGAAAVIGAVNIILLTALGTVTTFIYNLCSDLVGGLELTLSERD